MPELHDAVTISEAPGAAANEYDPEYWNQLVDEQSVAGFLGLTTRTLQGWRYKGGGPQYVRISARCVRYRRLDLRDYAEARLRTSTSDPAEAA